MLYACIALGVLGSLLGVAISLAALVGALLGRALGAGLSPGLAALALLASLVALAGAVNMRAHWRKGALLVAVCGAAGLLALPEFFIAPAITLVLPGVLYVAGEMVLRRRVSVSVRGVAQRARDELARGDAAIGRSDEQTRDDAATGQTDELARGDAAIGRSDEQTHDDAATGRTDELARGDAATEQADEMARGDAATEQTDEMALDDAATEQTDELARGDAATEQTDKLARGDTAIGQSNEQTRGDAASGAAIDEQMRSASTLTPADEPAAPVKTAVVVEPVAQDVPVVSEIQVMPDNSDHADNMSTPDVAFAHDVDPVSQDGASDSRKIANSETEAERLPPAAPPPEAAFSATRDLVCLLRATPLRPRLRRRQRRLPRDKSHPKWMHLNSPHPRRLHLVRPRPESPHPNRPHLTIMHMKLPRQNRLHPMPTRRLLKNQTHSARAGASAAVKSGADIEASQANTAWLALVASAFFAKTQPEPRN